MTAEVGRGKFTIGDIDQMLNSYLDIPAKRLCCNYHFCHSVQAKRDTESSIFSKFWMPAFAGMTGLMALSTIMTQSRKPESSKFKMSWKPVFIT